MTCWTAGCDNAGEWDLALYQCWPNNDKPCLPVQTRCRPHTSDIRDWWITKHRGNYVMLAAYPGAVR